MTEVQDGLLEVWACDTRKDHSEDKDECFWKEIAKHSAARDTNLKARQFKE